MARYAVKPYFHLDRNNPEAYYLHMKDTDVFCGARINRDIWTRLKVYSATSGLRVQAIVAQALDKWLKAKGA